MKGFAGKRLRLVLATGNLGKWREFQTLLQGLELELALQSDWNVSECPEPHATFIENALAKARHASQHTGLPALADDSGLCVQAIDGAPGVHSARFALNERSQASAKLARNVQDQANNSKLLSELVAVTDRRAHFVCVLAAVRHSADPEPLIAHGWLHGRIAVQAAGEGGFGYDSIFLLPETNLTLAQISAAQKNSVSHRACAARQLALLLQEFWRVGSVPRTGGPR